MRTKIIPFDLETAKKIQAGEIKGRIITSSLKNRVRILYYDYNNFHKEYKLVCAITRNEIEYLIAYTNSGSTMDSDEGYLVLEVPDNEPKFKPFDKVLVRNYDGYWVPRLFDMYSGATEKYYCQDGKDYYLCVPYEGNQELVGTTDKPKEE